jgi:hypothetical protein
MLHTTVAVRLAGNKKVKPKPKENKCVFYPILSMLYKLFFASDLGRNHLFILK